ncbi:hypothetical protein V8G54_027099 [Vigna mungo]|uniref:Uncharacterized protein n=1 Tax=Vigna mungo TaxID=3915 RepID=A0AAQ3N1T3_VIGMU
MMPMIMIGGGHERRRVNPRTNGRGVTGLKGSPLRKILALTIPITIAKNHRRRRHRRRPRQRRGSVNHKPSSTSTTMSIISSIPTVVPRSHIIKPGSSEKYVLALVMVEHNRVLQGLKRETQILAARPRKQIRWVALELNQRRRRCGKERSYRVVIQRKITRTSSSSSSSSTTTTIVLKVLVELVQNFSIRVCAGVCG